MVEKFPVYHHFFTIINLSLTSKKRAKSLTPSIAKQCSLIDNQSTLLSLFSLITEKSLLDVDFSVEDIENIINILIQFKLLVLSSNLARRKAFSHLNGKKQMSHQFKKKRQAVC